MKKILLVFSIIFVSFSAFALEFTGGGEVVNNFILEDVDMSAQELTVQETLYLSGWFDMYHEDGEGFSLALTAKGYLKIDGEWVNGSLPQNHIPLLLNVDLLRLNLRKTGAMTFDTTIGRMYFTDPTGGMVLGHKADGFKMSLTGQKLRMGLSGAYTGLISNPESNIRISDQDKLEVNTPKAVVLGPQRLYFQADVNFLGQKSLKEYTIFAAAQFDLRLDTSVARVHSQYFGLRHLKLHGLHLYEHNYFVFSVEESLLSGGDIKTVIGALFGLNYNYLRRDWLNSSMTFSLHAGLPSFLNIGQIVPGISIPFGLNGTSPLNKPTFSPMMDISLSSIAILQTGYSFRPFSGGNSDGIMSRLQLSVGVKGFFLLGNFNLDWIDTRSFASDFHDFSPYLGTEFDWGITWRLFSDVGVGLSGAVFVPANGTGGAASADASVISTVRLDLSMSF